MLLVKNILANAGNTGNVGSIAMSGRSPGGGHCNPLQYSCLENSMDRGAWLATVHRAAKSQTQLSDFHFQYFSLQRFAKVFNYYNIELLGV